MWQFLDVKKLIGARDPEIGEAGVRQLFQDWLQRFGRQGMQDYEALAFFSVGDAGYDENLFRGFGQLLEFFFDFYVRDHFAADFAETAEAVGDGQETVFVFCGDVAGGVPAVLQNFGGFFGLAEIAEHYVGAVHEEQAGRADFTTFTSFRVHDADTDAGEGMADASALGADLAKARGAKIARVDGYHGR